MARCKAGNTMSGAIMQTPGMHFPISTYQANVPQLDVQVDRDKAKAQGVSLTDLSVRCKPIWGRRMPMKPVRSYLARDGAGRRAIPRSVEDIANLRTRNNQGEMVPIGSMVNISTTTGRTR
jgi:multidrug efflux pump